MHRLCHKVHWNRGLCLDVNGVGLTLGSRLFQTLRLQARFPLQHDIQDAIESYG